MPNKPGDRTAADVKAGRDFCPQCGCDYEDNEGPGGHPREAYGCSYGGVRPRGEGLYPGEPKQRDDEGPR